MIEENDNNKSSHPIPKKLSVLIKASQFLSTAATKKLALKIFYTPIKYSTPEREIAYKSSVLVSREKVNNKVITVYQEGQSNRKVLLVHGWSGRASQFHKLGPALKDAGFKVYSFTAPAHGTSTDKQTDMLEISDCVKYLDGHHGPFEAIVSHSIGSAASLNAIANHGLTAKKAVLLGAPGAIETIVSVFCKRLKFKETIKDFLIDHLKKNYGEDYEQYSVTRFASKMTIPGLIIHDVYDHDVSVEDARENHKAWKNSEYLETKGLGHRLILSDETVINRIITFLK